MGLTASLITGLVLLSTACLTPLPPGEPATRAETSGFTETTRYNEVLRILNTLDEHSSNLRLETFGETAEGRPLPLAVMGTPPPKSPEDIDRNRTTLVFINANIHAGEVAGKEACLMLMREILTGSLGYLLENTVVLVAPIYNADGNERIDPKNRYWQKGPDRGVGIRPNAQTLDLNRDMMKLETPEGQSLVKNVLDRWDPVLVVDCHTTNGSYHQEPVTYAPSHLPFADPELLHFNQFVMLPWIAENTLKRTGYLSIPYGNFKDAMAPEKGWGTYDHRPRYVSNYVGLRNQLSILVEMYAYAEYEVRVKSCYAFLQSILEYSRLEGAKMRAVKVSAEQAILAAARKGGTPLRFFTEFSAEVCPEPLVIQGYKMYMKEDRGRQRAFPIYEEPVEYRVPYLGIFKTEGEGTPLPDSYLFPRGMIEIREKLEQQGIVLEEIAESFIAEAWVFHIETIETSDRLFQGHRINSLKGQWKKEKVPFPGGAIRVPVNQPLARLAAYLLEPESDDGLAAWNFLDRYLTRGQWDSRPGTYPIVKWNGDKAGPSDTSN
jgi:hypothetical protein